MINRNIVYLIAGGLAVATVALSYQLYQERRQTTGIEISVGEGSISVEQR